jgi:hypothetical protein
MQSANTQGVNHQGASAARMLASLFAFGVIVFACTEAQAQITLLLNTPSQLPERVGDWKQAQWNAQISVIVQSARPQPFTIAATIRNLDNNSTLFRTTGQTRQFQTSPRPLFATDIFPSGSFDYDRSVAETVIRSGMMPEGQYELCVSVLSPAGQTLATQCRQFNVVIPDPPSLISPANGDTLARAGTAIANAPNPPLLPMFQWTPVIAGANRQPRYRLRVVPLFDGQQARQALEGNPVLVDKIVVGSNYQWLPSDPLFSNYPSAKSFAWQVQSVESSTTITAPTNVTPNLGAGLRAIARNEGRSEMFVFGLGNVSSSNKILITVLSGNGKRKSPFDNSPKGTGPIGRNTPMPMSVIKGVIQWSYRTSEMNPQPLQGSSQLNANLVACTGETVSVTLGNNLGANPTRKELLAVAGTKQYPLSKLTVKIVAIRSGSDGSTEAFNLGGKTVSINTKIASTEILLGTATTDPNGAFAVEFVNPIFAKQGAKIGDTVVQVKKLIKGKETLVNETIPLYENTGKFDSVGVKIIAESPYFLLESRTVTMQADSVQKTLDVGTLAALARTFRLKTEVFVRSRGAGVDDKGKVQDAQTTSKVAEGAQVTVLRAQDFYNDLSVLVPEKKLKPLTMVSSVAGTSCAELQRISGAEIASPLFLNQSGMHDRYYVRVRANKCETLETVLQVDGTKIAPDGVVEITQRFVLNSAGGSLVRGSLKRLNLENAPASTPLAALTNTKNGTTGLDNVKIALVPFLVADPNVKARLNVPTDNDGSFTIDSVPKGAYLLQAAGAALYLNKDMKLAVWTPNLTINGKPDATTPAGTTSNFKYEYLKGGNTGTAQDATSTDKRSPGILVVVDGESEEEFVQGYVISPLAIVCGRMTDDLENLADSIEITTDKLTSAKAKTDKDGRFAINVPYGSNNLSFNRAGFATRIINKSVEAPPNFFIPPVTVINFNADIIEQKASGSGSGKLDNLLIELKGLDRINPNPESSVAVGDLFSSGLMRGIATGAMSKMVNSPSLLPVGAGGTAFTMSGTGYASSATPIKGLNIQSLQGVYSQSESNLFGAFTADIFSNGSAAGKQAFGKDAVWEDAAWYDEHSNHVAHSPNTAAMPMQADATSNLVTIVDLGIQQLTRSVGLAVNVRAANDNKWISKAIVTIGDKAATTTNTNNNQDQTPATIKGLQPGTVAVRVEGPEDANYVPKELDVLLSAKDDITKQTVKLELGGRITGTVTVLDASGKTLALDNNANAELLKNLRVRTKGLEDVIFTSVKPDGSFVLRGVKTGNSTIVAAAPSFMNDEKSVSVSVNESKQLNFTLKKAAIALDNLFGFPIEISDLKQTNPNTATVSGAFVNVPNNAVFAVASSTRIPFKSVELKQEAGKWVPTKTTIITDVPQLAVRAFGGKNLVIGQSLPLLLKGSGNTNIAFQASTGDKLKGTVVGDVRLDYNEFINLGKGPWTFEKLGSLSLSDVPPLFRSDGSNPASNLVLKLPDASEAVQIYSIGTNLTLKGATLDANGLHLKGSLQLTDAGFADVFGKGTKAASFTVNTFDIKPNASIGAVEIAAGKTGVSFSKGVFDFNLIAIDFTVEGLKTSGTLGFTLGEKILTATGITFSDLTMFVSNESNSFGVAAGIFDFSSQSVKLAGFPLAGKGFTFGIVSNSSPMEFFLSGTSEMTGLKYIDKLGLSLTVQSDGTASASAAANYEASWAGMADFKLAGMTLDVGSKNKQPTLDVDGSIKLNIPGVAALQGGGFVFAPDGLKTVKSFGGEIDLKIAKLKIGALAFGENNPSKQMKDAPSTKGGGPNANGFESEMESALYDGTNKGFRADNVQFTIPGIGLDATASFWYYSLSGGIEVGTDIIVPGAGLPPITLGPVFITPTGGGFTLNTADKDFALRLYSSISIAGAEDVVAFKPTVMQIKAGASAGIQVSGSAILQIFGEQMGDAKFFFAPVQAKFRVDANVEKTFDPLFGVSGVTATGKANVTVDLDGKQGYMYAGVGLDAEVNVSGLMKAKAIGGLVLGYNVPRSAMTPEQANALPSAAIDKFSGVAFRLDTKVGKEEYEAPTHDIWICDAKVWAYSKGGAKYWFLNTGQGFTSGFELNSAWGAGARCGCVGAALDIGAALYGGYNRDGTDTGWFFGGKMSGSAELCLKWCVDLDVDISVDYQQRNDKKLDFDISVDW